MGSVGRPISLTGMGLKVFANAGRPACALTHAPWATVASMIPTSQPQAQPSDNINAIIADVLRKPKVCKPERLMTPVVEEVRGALVWRGLLLQKYAQSYHLGGLSSCKYLADSSTW